MKTPSDYGLPHDKFREGQEESIERVLRLDENDVLVVQADTGSGKTAIPAAAGHIARVIALSETKLLQQENYGTSYNFDFLFGRNNYPCAAVRGTTAQLCKCKTDPSKCDYFAECEYYTVKSKIVRSKKAALNYAYFMTARWPRALAPSGFLVLDEAHLLSDIVVEHSSITVTREDKEKYLLPEFPQISSKGGSMFFKNDPIGDAIEWLLKCEKKVRVRVIVLESKLRQDRSFLKEYNAAENFLYKITGTISGLQLTPNDWFIRSGPRARELSGDKRASGFICKPLTARHHFPRWFILGGPTVLMSATIGNFETFTEELGINEYDTLTVPSVWTPNVRPVYYHTDAPGIGMRATDTDYKQQADIIADMIKSVPKQWSGVVHTTSKYQASVLSRRLSMRGLQDRIWVPPAMSTNKQLDQWQYIKRRTPGSIAVAWCWWTGVDLLDEKINILSKTPFPFCGDEYSRERMQYDGKMYLQRTAWQLQQGCGRTRRGRPEDYDMDGKRNGLVAIVDSNWKRVRKYLDQSFLESMTEWNA